MLPGRGMSSSVKWVKAVGPVGSEFIFRGQVMLGLWFRCLGGMFSCVMMHDNTILLAQALVSLCVSQVMIQTQPHLGCQEGKMGGIGRGMVPPCPILETLPSLLSTHTAQILLIGPRRWTLAVSSARRNRGKLGIQFSDGVLAWRA